MPDPKVTFAVDAKHAPAAQAFLDLIQVIDRTGQTGTQTGKKFKAAGEEAARGWDGALTVLNSYPTALVKLVSGTAAVTTAARLAVAEYQRLLEVRGKALEGMKEAREPYQRALMSASPEYAASKEFEQMSRAGIEAIGNTPAYFRLLSAGLSSKGALSEPQVHHAANLVAKMAGKGGWDDETAEAFMLAINDAMNLEISKGRTPHAEQIAGMLLSTFPATASTTVQQLSRYDMRGILNLVKQHNASYPEAVGFQSAFETIMNEHTGRRASTAVITLFEGIDKAFFEAYEKGLRNEGLGPAEFYKLTAREKVKLLQSDTQAGLGMRAWLKGLRSDVPRERDLAYLWGEAYMGHEMGEKGAQVATRQFLAQGADKALELVDRLAQEVSQGEKSAELLHKQLEGPVVSRQQAIMEGIRQQEGVVASVQWGNAVEAQKGLLQKLQTELGTATGTGYVRQKIRDLTTTLGTIGPADLADLQPKMIDIARRSISDLRQRYRMPRDFSEQRAFHRWAEQHHPELKQGFFSIGGIAGYEPEAWREYAELKMRDEGTAGQVEALERFIQETQKLMGQTEAGAPRSTETSPAAKRGWVQESAPENAEPAAPTASAPAAPAPAAPAATDQSAILQRLDAAATSLEQAALALREQKLSIAIDDPGGRPLTRSTSGYSPLELLSDNAAG